MNTTAQRTRSNRHRHGVAALVLLLAAAHLWAQQPTEDAPTHAPTPVPQTTTSETETPAPAEPPAATNPEKAVAETPANANSPFDYRASEKISEDLSVSFPVDI
jgi:outer membrane biosynthesis protein TonB